MVKGQRFGRGKNSIQRTAHEENLMCCPLNTASFFKNVESKKNLSHPSAGGSKGLTDGRCGGLIATRPFPEKGAAHKRNRSECEQKAHRYGVK
jgi:hypothetical protein